MRYRLVGGGASRSSGVLNGDKRQMRRFDANETSPHARSWITYSVNSSGYQTDLTADEDIVLPRTGEALRSSRQFRK